MKIKREGILSALLIWIPSIFYMYRVDFQFNSDLIIVPIIMSIFSMFCILGAAKLYKSKRIPKTLYYVVSISIPLYFSINQFVTVLSYGSGYNGILKNNNILAGLLIIVVGNYLPKVQFSKFVGLKFWWLEKRQDIWKKSHLLAGYLWIIAGIIMIMAPKPSSKVTIGIYFLLLYIIPLLYALFLKVFTDSEVEYN